VVNTDTKGYAFSPYCRFTVDSGGKKEFRVTTPATNKTQTRVALWRQVSRWSTKGRGTMIFMVPLENPPQTAQERQIDYFVKARSSWAGGQHNERPK